MEITINAKPVFEFTDYNDWLENGQKRFAPWVKVYGKDHTVRVFDTQGNILTCGLDFRLAMEKGHNPFVAYQLTRPEDKPE
jgi:hypothetical protein